MTQPRADVLANSRRSAAACSTSSSQNLGAGLGALGGLLAAGVAFAMTFCGFSSIASAGRMLFAFSRDDGVPGSGWLKKGQPSLPNPEQLRDRDQLAQLAAHPAGLRR